MQRSVRVRCGCIGCCYPVLYCAAHWHRIGANINLSGSCLPALLKSLDPEVVDRVRRNLPSPAGGGQMGGGVVPNSSRGVPAACGSVSPLGEGVQLAEGPLLLLARGVSPRIVMDILGTPRSR